MKGLTVTCPECGTHINLLHAMEDADGRRFIGLLSEVQPVVVRPLVRYLTLFKPVKQGMRWSRMYSLANELLPMIKAAEIERNGTHYVVPPDRWASTMLALVEEPPKTLKLPLKSHGYLFTILAGEAESEEAKKEQKHIEQQRHRVPVVEKAPEQVPTKFTDECRAKGLSPIKVLLQQNQGKAQEEQADD